MGISLIPAMFLARNAHHASDGTRALVLGRQKLHMPPPKRARFLKAVSMHGFDLAEGDITQPDGFTETLLSALGYPPFEAMDFTDKEGAAHVHDLNLPVPDDLREAFDLVLDGGTTEHIFHIGQALMSCHEMIRPGGLMMGYVSADGWFGHGFFQTGPDVPWRFWHHHLGYEMLEVSIVCRTRPRRIIPIPDPTGHPRGGEMALEGPHMIFYCCRKPARTVRPAGSPIQGHYV